MLSNFVISFTFQSYKRLDLKRKFLFFNRFFFSFIRLSIMSISIQKFNTLISLLRSPFVNKKSFEQFFYSFYNCKFNFFFSGQIRSYLINFIHSFAHFPPLYRFISKVEILQHSSFFF